MKSTNNMCVINEEWRAIEGYEGLYEVSSLGRVRSIPHKFSFPNNKDGILACSMASGYKHVVLSKKGKSKGFLVHRLVASAFLIKPRGRKQVNHKDENKLNNAVSNLEWVTPRQNLEHSNVIKKLVKAAIKANEKPVLMFTKNGEFIREFKSATIAAQSIGSFQQNVSTCCRDWNKSTKGYKFKFKK